MKFIYYHIGKCGGSSIRNLFTNINQIKYKVFNTENSFENYCFELINDKRLINDLEYIEVHAGQSISFYNSIDLIKNLKLLYEDKIFVFITLRDPLETIISLYHYDNSTKNKNFEYFQNNYVSNYITNYLYSGSAHFKRCSILPNSDFDKKNIKNINDFYINSSKFKNLINYLDYYVDYIVYIDNIESLIQFINKNYIIKLKYENLCINKNNYDKFNITEIDKKIFIDNLYMDYIIYNRYRHKKKIKMYLGTCRICGGSNVGNWRSKYFNIKESSEIGEIFSYPHTTKEIIMLLKFINNEIDIPENKLYKCFRSFYIKSNNINKYKNDKDYLFNILKNIDIFILEISSRKTYCDQNKYYYCYDYINTIDLKELNCLETNIMNDDDILQDIKFIQNYLKKPILIISHINCKLNNLVIEKRDNLIKSLENICDKNNIAFHNPTKILDYYNQKNIMEMDLNHYNRYYHDIITRVINYNIK